MPARTRSPPWTFSFEQLDHARQTAGLDGLARSLREHVAGIHRLAVLHHEVRVRRHLLLRRASDAGGVAMTIDPEHPS